MPPPREPKTPLTLPAPWRRVRFNLECIGWSQSYLAKVVRLDESGVRQMCRGQRRFPDQVAIFTEQLAAIHRALWEPINWNPKGKSSMVFIEPEFDPDDTEVAPEIQLTPRHLLPDGDDDDDTT